MRRPRTMALALTLLAGVLLAVVRAQTDRASALRGADLAAKAVDLTYPFDESTIYWPADKSFQRERTHWGPSPGGYWYASATYGASEHGGTHLDSPIHFAQGGASTEQIPLSKLIGPA